MKSARWLAVVAALVSATATGVSPPWAVAAPARASSRAEPSGHKPGRAAFMAALKSNPEYGDVWTALQRDFPDEAWRAVDVALAQDTPQRAEMLLAQYMSRFMLDNAATAASASDDDMLAFLERSYRLYALLQQQSDRLCADVALSKPGVVQQLSGPKVRAAVHDRALLLLRAIKDGRDHPLTRGPITAPDRAAFLTALKAVGASPEVVALQDGHMALATAAPREQCQSTVLTMKAISQLPKEQAARFASLLLARYGGDLSAGSDPTEIAKLTSRTFLDQMEAEPNTGPSWRLLESEFPNEMRAMADEGTQAAKTQGMQAAVGVVLRRYTAFIQMHRSDVTRAPDIDLSHIAVASGRFIKTLQGDDENRCALYGVKGVMPPEPLSPQVQIAAFAMNAVVVEAIVDAHRSQVDHAGITAADAKLLLAQLQRRHVAPAVLDALKSSGSLEGLPLAQQCQGSVDLLQGIGDLPADVSARFMAATLGVGAKDRDNTPT